MHGPRRRGSHAAPTSSNPNAKLHGLDDGRSCTGFSLHGPPPARAWAAHCTDQQTRREEQPTRTTACSSRQRGSPRCSCKEASVVAACFSSPRRGCSPRTTPEGAANRAAAHEAEYARGTVTLLLGNHPREKTMMIAKKKKNNNSKRKPSLNLPREGRLNFGNKKKHL